MHLIEKLGEDSSGSYRHLTRYRLSALASPRFVNYLSEITLIAIPHGFPPFRAVY
jgi:hypothetical protein